MHRSLFGLTCVIATSLLMGCSDGSDSRPGGGTPPPGSEISLDETGIYSGTLETDSGQVALMRLKLARDGTTAILLDTDDDETPNIILWGESDGENGAITFAGTDTGSKDSISIDLQVENGEANGRLELSSGVAGDYRLAIDQLSDRPSDLRSIAGEYARDDNLNGLRTLTISPDGSVQLSGPCQAAGSATAIDAAVNLYHLTLDSDCVSLDALVSLEDVTAEEDLVSVTGDTGQGGLALDFYRI